MTEPGQVCPGCERRVPFPQTERSPQTKKKAYWVPLDEHRQHEEVLKSAAQHLGVYEQPFWEFKTSAMALYLILEDESLRGFANRAWVPPTTEYPDLDATQT